MNIKIVTFESVGKYILTARVTEVTVLFESFFNLK